MYSVPSTAATWVYHDTLSSEETGMQVTKLREMTELSKISLLPWLCFFQMPAHFSITQETSQGSMFLPFPWSICTIIAAAVLDYLQFIPEGPVRQSQNVLYKGSLSTDNSAVLWLSHTYCTRSSCTSHWSSMQVSTLLHPLPTFCMSDPSKFFPKDCEIPFALRTLAFTEWT